MHRGRSRRTWSARVTTKICTWTLTTRETLTLRHPNPVASICAPLPRRPTTRTSPLTPNSFNSDREKVVVYAEALAGAAFLRLDVDGRPCSASLRITPADPLRYRAMACDDPNPAKTLRIAMTADQGPARVLLRDYYPLIE